MSQKALALTVHVDQSRLCALERGRISAFDNDLITRLARGLGLSEEELHHLQWAMEHDRLLEELERTSLSRARSAVSELLSAAEMLTQDELQGLAREIRAIGDSKRKLQSLTQRVAHRPSDFVGGPA